MLVSLRRRFQDLEFKREKERWSSSFLFQLGFRFFCCCCCWSLIWRSVIRGIGEGIIVERICYRDVYATEEGVVGLVFSHAPEVRSRVGSESEFCWRWERKDCCFCRNDAEFGEWGKYLGWRCRRPWIIGRESFQAWNWGLWRFKIFFFLGVFVLVLVLFLVGFCCF